MQYANLVKSCKQIKRIYIMHNGMLQYGFGAQSAAFLPFAGGRSAPSLTSLHIVETNQEISVKNCSTPESCRYIIKS